MSRKINARLIRGAPVFAALGDETRLRVLAKLAKHGPLSITQITEGEEVTRQAITKHLAVLADSGLVHDVRRGRERLWEVELAPLEEARRCLDLVSAQWDRTLAQLKDFVEAEDE